MKKSSNKIYYHSIIFFVYIILSSILLFVLFCNEHSEPEIIQSPTGEPNICDNAESGPCNYNGAFCFLGDKIVYYCILQDETGIEIISEAQFGDIICSLNELWESLVENIEANSGEFDADELSSAFNKVITDNKENISLLISYYLTQEMLCEEDEDGNIAADSIAAIGEYIDELSSCDECLADPHNPGTWPSETWQIVADYIGMVGLTIEAAVNIITNTAIQLDTDLDLINISAAINTSEACTFNEGSLTATSYNANLIDLIDFLIDNSSEGDIHTIVDGLLESEIPYLIDVAVNLLEAIHTESTDQGAINGLFPTIPSIFSGLITSDMDRCP